MRKLKIYRQYLIASLVVNFFYQVMIFYWSLNGIQTVSNFSQVAMLISWIMSFFTVCVSFINKSSKIKVIYGSILVWQLRHYVWIFSEQSFSAKEITQDEVRFFIFETALGCFIYLYNTYLLCLLYKNYELLISSVNHIILYLGFFHRVIGFENVFGGVFNTVSIVISIIGFICLALYLQYFYIAFRNE